MSSSHVPFYSQAVVLDRYIHAPNPNDDPDAVDVIMDMLKTQPELRAYFFRSRPSPAWAAILWEHGFFQTPPEPQASPHGYLLPRWDIQDFLISVAAQAPDIVVKHLESVQGDGWYISQAIRALEHTPLEILEAELPRLMAWLHDPLVARSITLECHPLLRRLVESKRESAFDLFEVLADPAPQIEPSERGARTQPQAEPLFQFSSDPNDESQQLLVQLSKLDVQRLVTILEGKLRNALDEPASGRTSQTGSRHRLWWRSAIEPTNQDILNTYYDQVLNALRDALETTVERDPNFAEAVIRRYLADEHDIFRRLALHLLQRSPDRFPPYVREQLLRFENLNDSDIHHEFMLLLRAGFAQQSHEDQDTLVNTILTGPPPEDVQKLAEWLHKERGVEIAEYVDQFKKSWILDRLWMLKDSLDGLPKERLNSFVAELGIPQHPDFRGWVSGAFVVQDVSPTTAQELARLEPSQFVQFVREWQPDPQKQFGPERESYLGMAAQVAAVVKATPEHYADAFGEIALLRPEYADVLFSQYAAASDSDTIPWSLCITWFARLLKNQGTENQTDHTADSTWISVRIAILRLIEVGLNNKQHKIPTEQLLEIRDILLALVDDPDPTLEHDRPPEGWSGHQDPATVALNHVRPLAVRALIEYAREKWLQMRNAGEAEVRATRTLEPPIREALSRKVDWGEEKSLAVHSVFGLYLPTIYWVDREWTQSHLDKILPIETDDEATQFFVAAWDSFVLNAYPAYLKGELHSKYQRAISNISRGYLTRTHLQPVQHLAIHVMWDYFQPAQALGSVDSKDGLLAQYFTELDADARASAIWACWRICADNKPKIDQLWPRVRALWEWRAQQASIFNHSSDFDKEMEWFAHVLLESPSSESLSTMWPLLEGMLPHIGRSETRAGGWDRIEQYLAREIERDPLRVIRFYRLMCEHETQPRWSFRNEQGRKILQVALERTESRDEALTVIDLLARRGIDIYKDLYDQYAS